MSRQLEEVASNSDEDSEGGDDAEHSGAKDSSLNTALHDFDDEELEEYSVKALTAEIASLEEQVNQLKSNISLDHDDSAFIKQHGFDYVNPN